MDESNNGRVKCIIYKNLLALSFAVFLLLTGYFPIHDLQTSLYNSSSLGRMSLCAGYSGIAIGSVLLGTTMINKFGTKITIVISLIGFLLFILANSYGTWWTLIPTALIQGLGSGVFWTAAASYIKELSKNYAEIQNVSADDAFSRFYPIFFSIFKLSQISGNSLSSNILHFQRKQTNETAVNVSCGPLFCPSTPLPQQNLNVSSFQVITLVLVCLGFGCLSYFLLIIFVDRVKGSQEQTQTTNCNLVKSTFLKMVDIKMISLTPIIIFAGLQCGLVYADFTEAYVTCYIGVDMIGWTMCAFGLSSFLSSNIYSLIGKYLGAFNILIGTTIVHIALLTWLLKWDFFITDSLYPFVILAAIYGACDSSWRSQIPVILGSAFPTCNNEVFSLHMFWQSIGFALCFAYGQYICVYTKIYIVIVFMIIGMILSGMGHYFHIKSNIGWEKI